MHPIRSSELLSSSMLHSDGRNTLIPKVTLFLHAALQGFGQLSEMSDT
jgi:hypothetical protein